MIVDLYMLDVTVYDLRAKIRQGFERNNHVTDLNVIDILHHKGRQEFQEAINVWKQPVSTNSHLTECAKGTWDRSRS